MKTFVAIPLISLITFGCSQKVNFDVSHPVSFFITAEDQANVTSPGQTVVLRTRRVE